MWVGGGAFRKKLKEEVNEGFWGWKVLVVLGYWEWRMCILGMKLQCIFPIFYDALDIKKY
jgi:hypothetical protein